MFFEFPRLEISFSQSVVHRVVKVIQPLDRVICDLEVGRVLPYVSRIVLSTFGAGQRILQLFQYDSQSVWTVSRHGHYV